MTLDQHRAHRALHRVCGILNKSYRGRYWITCGTLLGVIRDGGFITHDGDIDLGLLGADFGDDLIPAFEAEGVPLEKRSGNPDDGLILTFADPDVRVDLFFCYREGDRIWHAVTNKKPQIRYYYPSFRIIPYVFRGIELFVPDPSTAVLEANYGPDWRKPVRRWHYAYSPYNVVVRGGPAQQAKYAVKRGIWEVKSRGKAAWQHLRAHRSVGRRGTPADG